MTSTSIPVVHPDPTPSNPQLRQFPTSAGVVINIMTSATSGTVVNSTDPSWPIGRVDNTWSNGAFFIGDIKLSQTA